MDQPERDVAQRPERIQLAGGLRAGLLPLRASTQAAALIRVHAGAHDAPAEYPGLAHFLEHLLFLDSDRYPPEQSLMPFVQGRGGQLNASTRERHTDFFFQLPAALLEQGLLRLLDMLAHPLLDPAAQVREREVLHAEYLARAQDSETLCDAALGTLVDGAHPFGGFHAGNRDSLPVETTEFQQALRGYHRRFYHAGQIELLLAGPQSEAQLQRLSELAARKLPSATRLTRIPLPLRASASWLDVQILNGTPGLHMGFMLDELPEDNSAALDYLALWISSEMPGSLLANLRADGLCLGLKWRVPYRYAGQAVVVLTFQLTERGRTETNEIISRVLGWLKFFTAAGDQQESHDEYRRIRLRSLQGFDPLEQLRYWVEPAAWSAASEGNALQRTFAAFMQQMISCDPVVLFTSTEECPVLTSKGFAVRARRQAPRRIEPCAQEWWRPEPNTWLNPPPLRKGATAADKSTLRWLAGNDVNRRGALHLRWRFTESSPGTALWHALWSTLQPCLWAAKQAGVTLRFEDFGHSWCLSLLGYAEAFPRIVEDIGGLLNDPPPQALAEGIRLASEAGQSSGDEMLIRQLIRQLPQRLARCGPGPAEQKLHLDQSALQRWQTAQRDGLAMGFAGLLADSLAEAMNAMPGSRGDAPNSYRNGSTAGLRWHDAGLRAADTAMLLFCSLPGAEPKTEAGWRLLARLMEAEFFRRLRGELQLGYAVFSGFRQIAGQGGMLFAVQSPNASAAQILAHVETFLADFNHKLAGFTPEWIKQQATALRDLLLDSEPAASMERAWQSHLAGHRADHPEQVAAALNEVGLTELHQQLAKLRSAEGGRLVIANAPPPGE